MTRGSKILALFLCEIGLLGAAFTGGYYHYMKRGPLVAKLTSCEKERAALPKQLADCQSASAELKNSYPKLMSRAMLMEAEVALLRGDPQFAFERVVRAQLSLPDLSKDVQDGFTDVINLILSQDAAARDKVLHLAEKILPMPIKVPQPGGAGGKKAAEVPGVAVPVQKGGAAPGPQLDEAYQVLLDAKTLLLSGETGGLTQKLARARVLLDEAGRSDMDAELDALIAAARRREQQKLLGGIDAVIKRVRAP